MPLQHFTLISIFPEIFSTLTCYGVTARAIQENKVKLRLINPRDYTRDKHASVDDKPFGGGPGMLMKPEPLSAAINQAKKLTPEPYISIYLSPQGQVFTQHQAKKLAQHTNLILLCGRYEGIDQRIIEKQIDQVWSIGDYVLTGGELPAMVIIDSIVRLLPEVLGNSESAIQESFVANLLDYPQYTRPQHFLDQKVPDVLLSGDHKRISLWRLKQSLGYTLRFRPEVLAQKKLSDQEQQLLQEFIRESENKPINCDT